VGHGETLSEGLLSIEGRQIGHLICKPIILAQPWEKKVASHTKQNKTYNKN